MSVNRKITPLTVAVIIIAIVGSALAVSVTYTGATNAAPDKTSTCEGRYLNTAVRMHGNFSAFRHWNQSRSWNVTTTSTQAQAVVTAAVPSFTVGEAKERGSLWVVNVTYNGKAVMNVPLAKINTPTSRDAVNVVQVSQSKGWTAGTAKQFTFVYNVPIVDSNGNTIGIVRVDGRTGQIISGNMFAGFRMRAHA
jgi:hypothetical protein